MEDITSRSDQDDFFIKIWPDEKVEIKPSQPESTTVAPITTADNIVGGEPRVKFLLIMNRINNFFLFIDNR